MVHFRLGSYLRFLLLKDKIGSFRNCKILDAGCNYGEIAKVLVGNNKVFGIDTDESVIQIAKKTVKQARFTKASVTKIPFPDKYFDVVICLSVLEHIRDDQKALGEISRVLTHDGELVLTISNKNASLVPFYLSPIIKLFNRFFKTAFPVSQNEFVHFGKEGIGHVRQGYSRTQIENMLRQEKLVIISYKTYWHFPTRLTYLFLTPLLKNGILTERLVKFMFRAFFTLDKVFKDEKGDCLIIANKIKRSASLDS